MRIAALLTLLPAGTNTPSKERSKHRSLFVCFVGSNMQQFTYTIKDRDGIHARPAGVIIKAAKAFQSKITIEAHGKTADLKGGIFALMGLGIRCGWDVVVTIDGPDEDIAYVELQNVFAQTI